MLGMSIRHLKKSSSIQFRGKRSRRTYIMQEWSRPMPCSKFSLRKALTLSLYCMKYETNSFKHDILIKVKAMDHDAVSHTHRSLDTQATRSVEMDTGHPSVCDFLIRNSGDIAMVLKKA
jgi:hypothetical protein